MKNIRRLAFVALGLLGVCVGCTLPASNSTQNPGTSAGSGTANGGGGGSEDQAVPEPAWKPAGDRVTWSGFSFIVPPGMTGTDQSTHYEMVDRGDSAGTNACSITINKPVAASGDLAQQANDILTQAYGAQGYQVLDDNYGADLVGNRTYTQSSQGWDYVELRAELRKGSPSAERGHIMLIGLGGEVLPILGYSPTSSGCTQLAHDFKTGIVGEVRWRELAFSFDFPSAEKKAPPSIVGEWSLYQGSAGEDYAFAANRRYGFWGAISTERRVSTTEIEVTTSSFAGDGAYAVQGDVLGIFPDGKPAEGTYFRVFEQHAVSPSGKVTREVKLGMMKKDVGGVYEVALVKK